MYKLTKLLTSQWALVKKHTPDYTESFTKYGQKADKSELIASIADDSNLVDEPIHDEPDEYPDPASHGY